MYKFHNNSPLCLQLYKQIKADIVKGRLKANEKMPSLRTLAGDYNISKTTVLNAYNQLCIEGYISSIPKRGYFVSEDLYTPNLHVKKSFSCEEQNLYQYDFYGANLDSRDFPKKIWQRLYNKA